MSDLQNYLDNFRKLTEAEDALAKEHNRKLWQDLFHQVHHLPPFEVQPYVHYEIKDWSQAELHSPYGERHSWGHTATIRIPDLPPIYMQVVWDAANRNWQIKDYSLRRVSAVKLDQKTKTFYVDYDSSENGFTSSDFTLIMREAVSEGDYGKLVLEEIQQKFPNPGGQLNSYYSIRDLKTKRPPRPEKPPK